MDSFSFCLVFLTCVILCMVVRITNGNGYCEYEHKNYTGCDLMLWTSWTPCDGNICPHGQKKRDKGVCCPSYGNQTKSEIKEACKMNCNLTDADFFELAAYVPPSTTTTTTTTITIITTAKPTASSTTTTSSRIPSKKTNLVSTVSSVAGITVTNFLSGHKGIYLVKGKILL